MSGAVVVVGAGQAAASFASRHVALGHRKPLVLVGEEPHPPYQRPPLSKKYLRGELQRERLFIRPADWYDEQGIQTHFNTRIGSIDRAQKQLSTATGEIIGYDKLVLCTGSSARQLPAESGGDLDGIFTLRNIADIDHLKPEVCAGRRLLIIGGGYIGLEAAAVATELGLKVTLIEMSERIMQRVAAVETSDYFRQLHQSHGVEIRESTGLKRLIGNNGRVCTAELITGEKIDFDLVLVGIGGVANTELAVAAGLDCANGVQVNSLGQTSDPDIYAAGDCCCFSKNGLQLRVESVQNAADQGDLVARNIGGEKINFDAMPWFWSDQYDCKLQIAGLNHGYNQTVVRPGDNPQSQSIWYYADDRLLAIDAMNQPKSYAFGRMMIERGRHPSRSEIANPNTDLKSLAKR